MYILFYEQAKWESVTKILINFTSDRREKNDTVKGLLYQDKDRDASRQFKEQRRKKPR